MVFRCATKKTVSGAAGKPLPQFKVSKINYYYKSGGIIMGEKRGIDTLYTEAGEKVKLTEDSEWGGGIF